MRILTAARALSTAARPFRVLGVQQVAVGSTDKHALRALWCDLLGVEKVHEYRSERENVDGRPRRGGDGARVVRALDDDQIFGCDTAPPGSFGLVRSKDARRLGDGGRGSWSGASGSSGSGSGSVGFPPGGDVVEHVPLARGSGREANSTRRDPGDDVPRRVAPGPTRLRERVGRPRGPGHAAP